VLEVQPDHGYIKKYIDDKPGRVEPVDREQHGDLEEHFCFMNCNFKREICMT
jgi:hypothetical protein